MLLTVRQVAERLNCSESQVYALLNCGLVYVQIGRGKQGGKRVDERDLEAFIASRRRGGAPGGAPRSARPKLKRLSPS